MELREKVARIIEPTLWDNPMRGLRVIGCSPNANIEGLKHCTRVKADRLLEHFTITEKE